MKNDTLSHNKDKKDQFNMFLFSNCDAIPRFLDAQKQHNKDEGISQKSNYRYNPIMHER
jgi:hypothetical protein